MSDFVNLPAPLTSYLLNDVSISRTLLNLFLNWNCLGLAVRTFRRNRMVAYSTKINHCMHELELLLPIRAPKTKMIQMMMKASMAVSPSAFGILLVILLKMLTRQRKTVTRMVILPGTLSGGTRKLIQETITNIPETKFSISALNNISSCYLLGNSRLWYRNPSFF